MGSFEYAPRKGNLQHKQVLPRHWCKYAMELAGRLQKKYMSNIQGGVHSLESDTFKGSAFMLKAC